MWAQEMRLRTKMTFWKKGIFLVEFPLKKFRFFGTTIYFLTSFPYSTSHIDGLVHI